MIENKELGIKIAESSDEEYWTNKREEVKKALDNNRHDYIIITTMLDLCNKQLEFFGKPNN